MLDQSIYDKADEIIKNHVKDKDPLIPVMKDIQAIYSTIAPELLSYVAQKLDISEEDAYSSASERFSVDLKGKYVVKVCDGIACHNKKGPELLTHLYNVLGLSADKNTTDDLLFTVEPSGCLRSCGQAPVMMVNDTLYPSMTPEKVSEIINLLRVEFNDLLENGIENIPSDKAINISGGLNNPGLYDLEPGMSIRDIIDNVCGGLLPTREFKAAIIGGSPGGCLIVTDLDYCLDFDSLKKGGTLIRTRTLKILDQNSCIVEAIRAFIEYTVNNEICGKCVPCREGTMRMLEILNDIVSGKGTPEHLNMLYELGTAITDTALCRIGIVAVAPVLYALDNFHDEFVEHIEDKKCRAGECKALSSYYIVPEICRGCSKCARNCPVGAISGEIKNPFVIDQSKCIKCGACASGCPFKAITIN